MRRETTIIAFCAVALLICLWALPEGVITRPDLLANNPSLRPSIEELTPEPVQASREMVVVEEPAEDRDAVRERVDQAFLARRRAGYVMWDDLTSFEQTAVDNLLALHEMVTGVPIPTIDDSLFGLHPDDRPLLDEFTGLLRHEMAETDRIERKGSEMIAKAKRGEYVAGHQEITFCTSKDDPRLINRGPEAFVLKIQSETPGPGYCELGSVKPHGDDSLEITLHRVSIGEDLTKSYARRRAIAVELFPRFYFPEK